MHAIEIADGQRRRTEIRRHFVETAKDAHRSLRRASHFNFEAVISQADVRR
jgi:hypothetical protein